MDALLPYLAAGLVSFVIMMYVLLDGFDLGIGILFPFIRDKSHRSIMINTIAPVWDGNQTWLVLGGALLYGCFPSAFSALMPLFYFPIIIMSLALVLRGVAFEFRFKAAKESTLWCYVFSLASITAAFCQGTILGSFVYGVGHPTCTRALGCNTFSFFTGLCVVGGYALLGATFGVLKTKPPLQSQLVKLSKYLLICMLFMLVVISLWTPLSSTIYAEKWLRYPTILWLSPLPIASIIALITAWLGLQKKPDSAIPFLSVIAVFVLAFVGFFYSVWPYMVPNTLTITQAASEPKSLGFILAGAIVMIPVLSAYTAYGYYVFRGKVEENTFYNH